MAIARTMDSIYSTYWSAVLGIAYPLKLRVSEFERFIHSDAEGGCCPR
jgi:hypothetical protein